MTPSAARSAPPLGSAVGDFVFTSALGGVASMNNGEPQFAETFDEQLRLVGEHVARRLAHFDCTPADIVDATVWLHPAVDIDPGEMLDRLQETVFLGCAPALSVARASCGYDDSLVNVKVTAYKPR